MVFFFNESLTLKVKAEKVSVEGGFFGKVMYFTPLFWGERTPVTHL